MSSHQFAYAQKRRSTRIDQAIPLLVQGVGAMREPYQEQVSTLSISCHGCTYESKHEVIQGETVYLDIKPPNGSSVGCSSRARVKWAQKFGAKERAFQIAVELEIAGNIWGVASPPADWFPRQVPEAVDTASLARELKVVHRKEQPAIPVPDAESNRLAVPTRDAVAAPPVPQITHPVPQIAQLMVGLGEQIQSMAAQAAAAALVKEKGRLIEEFRAQLRDEAIKTIQSAISASKEVIASPGHEGVERSAGSRRPKQLRGLEEEDRARHGERPAAYAEPGKRSEPALGSNGGQHDRARASQVGRHAW